VLGSKATGKVVRGLSGVLIPAEPKTVQGPIKMIYVASPDFTGYELEALWGDAAFGFKHWHQFRRIAIVMDSAWLRAAITMFRPFFPSQIRLFKLAELAVERDWIIRVEKASG